MKNYLLTIFLASLTQVLFAQWTTPTTGTTTTNDKIGIGTTSPVSKVEVVGNMGSTPILKLFNTDNVDGRSAILFQSNKPSLQGWEFGANVAGGSNIFGLRDITTTGFPIRFVVNTQGYFGIGTNNPSSLLHLASTNNIDLKLFSTAAGGYSRLFFGAGTNGARWNVGQRDDVGGIFSIEGDATGSGAWGSRLAISLSGNVGIGTPNPQSILDVKGSPNFKGDVVLYGDVNGGQSNTASPNLIFQGTNYAGATMLAAPLEDTYGRRGFAVYTHSDASDTRNLVERLRISNTGNVGIGTSSPDQKLTVNGTVHASQVKVDTQIPVPDYVFKKNYNLLPLAALKTYLDKNQHLPEIPSASEQEKEGLDLGKMNQLLLKKVEELTLYLIEKDKEIKELKQSNAEIKQLKKEFEVLKNQLELQK